MPEMIGRGRTAEIFSWEEGKVLKLYYAWCSPDWVEYEFKATQVAYQAGVTVPVPYELVEKEGRRGIIFERIHGVNLIAGLMRAPWKTRLRKRLHLA